MGRFQDFTDKKFNRLTVIKRAATINKRTMWLCKCDCGNECIVEAYHLKTGHSKSCGCLKDEYIRSSAKEKFTVHGLRYTRLYSIWHDIKNRCYNKNSINYSIYGGRNINICKEWKENFVSFYNWAMNNGYRDDLSIDRIDVNGNYEPTNCRWVDRKTQQRNMRSNRLITYNDETHCMSEWAEILGIKYSTLSSRITRQNLSIEEAFTRPINKSNRKCKG